MAEQTVKEHQQIRLITFVVLLLTVLTQLVDNAFTLITPILSESFHLSTNQASWIASLGGVGIAVGFFVISSFSDFISEKKLLIIGILLFCIPSITGLLFQQSYIMVVLSRFVQAIGGISLPALYLVLVTRYFQGREQLIWIGFSTTSFTLSTVIGTLAGGFLSKAFGWQVIFYIPFIALLALPLFIKAMPESKKGRGKIDYIGIILLTAFVVAINFFSSSPSLKLLLLSVLFLILFLVYIAKSKAPIMSIKFFKNAPYMFTLLATFFYFLLQVGLVFLTPYLLQGVFDFDIDKTSLIFIVPYTVSGILASFSGHVVNNIGKKKAVTLAAALLIAGLMYGAFLGQGSIVQISMALTLITSGYAFCFSPLLARSQSFLTQNELGTGVGLFNFVVRTSNALGISLTAFLLNAGLQNWPSLPMVSQVMKPYSYIFLILALTVLAGLVIYYALSGKETA